MGIRQKVQREMAETGLPDDLKQEFHDLSEWAHTLPDRFGSRIRLRLIDAASIEGFFKSLLRRFHRYPAFMVGGQRYVGSDFSRVDALIVEHLAGEPSGTGGGGGTGPLNMSAEGG
jgi:hypothetical protein